MATWGGLRDGAGRPGHFNERVGKVVYFDSYELRELNRLAGIISEETGEVVSASSILRSLSVEWIEETKERYSLEYKKLTEGDDLISQQTQES